MSTKIERGLVETSFGYLHYRAAGAGTPIMLLHVNQQSSALWLEMMEALAPAMRVVAVDYPSHGGSDHIANQPTIADYARAIIEVADALGLERFAVLGEATGAAVAADLSGDYASRVSKIVMINCPVNKESPEEMLAPFKGTFRPADPTGFPALRTLEFILETDPRHSPMHPTQDWMDRVNRAQIESGRDRWQALTALAHYDMIAGLGRVAHPVMLFTTEHFYFREHLPEIFATLGDRLAAAHDIPGGRVCAGWEFAHQIGPQVIAFAAGR
jgi:pimeloyl-ACP methyl ester carboxylesterase